MKAVALAGIGGRCQPSMLRVFAAPLSVICAAAERSETTVRHRTAEMLVVLSDPAGSEPGQRVGDWIAGFQTAFHLAVLVREMHECRTGIVTVKEGFERSRKRFVSHVLGKRDHQVDGRLGQRTAVHESVARSGAPRLVHHPLLRQGR